MTVTSAQARAPTSGGDWNLKCGNCHGEPAAAFFPHAAGQKAAGGVALCCLRVATPTRGRPQISLEECSFKLGCQRGEHGKETEPEQPAARALTSTSNGGTLNFTRAIAAPRAPNRLSQLSANYWPAIPASIMPCPLYGL